MAKKAAPVKEGDTEQVTVKYTGSMKGSHDKEAFVLEDPHGGVTSFAPGQEKTVIMSKSDAEKVRSGKMKDLKAV